LYDQKLLCILQYKTSKALYQKKKTSKAWYGSLQKIKLDKIRKKTTFSGREILNT
jgi:hypothetical protein